MARSEAMYHKALFGSKVGMALMGGGGIALLCVMAMTASNPSLESTSATEPTSLFSLASSKISPTQMMAPQMMARQLPGASPWKEMALAGIEASYNRDVSMNAAKSVMASMSSSDKALVARAGAAAVEKAQDLKAGITSPLGFWDPVGFSTNVSPGRLLFYREVEIKHGRVGMLAALGLLVGENIHPLYGGNVDVPSAFVFKETALANFWPAVAVAAMIPELFSFQRYPEMVGGEDNGMELKEGVVPGDLGFDPLGMKPKDEKGLLEMQNKELNNGRLAMLAAAGIIAQELVTGEKIFR